MLVKNNPRKAWSQASYGFLAHTDMHKTRRECKQISLRHRLQTYEVVKASWSGKDGEIFVDKRMVLGGNDTVHSYFKKCVEQRKGSAGPWRNAWLRPLGALAGDWGLVPSTQLAVQLAVQITNSSSRDSKFFSSLWGHQTHAWCAHTKNNFKEIHMKILDGQSGGSQPSLQCALDCPFSSRCPQQSANVPFPWLWPPTVSVHVVLVPIVVVRVVVLGVWVQGLALTHGCEHGLHCAETSPRN